MRKIVTSELTRRQLLKAVGGLSAVSLLAACTPAATPTPAAPKAAEPTKPAPAAPAPTAAAAPTKPSAAPTAAPTVAGAPTAAPAVAAGTPKRGGSSVWTAETDPITLDPHKSSNFSSAQAWGDVVYQSFVRFDEKMAVTPCLAESWENPDPTTVIFKLRKGVKFHSGQEFTSDDAVFWFERMSAKETAAPYWPTFNAITKIEAVDKYTAKVVLSSPFAPLMVTFAAMRGSAFVSRSFAKSANLEMQTDGTGPFKITEFVPYDHIKYVRHADYWEKGLPYLDEVTFKIVPEEETRIGGLRSGQVHYAFLSPEGAKRLANEKSITVMKLNGPQIWQHHLNCSRKPFDDVRVRQAINLAIDRKEAIEKAAGGEGSLTGPVPTGHGQWYVPVEELESKWYKRDIARAKQLLAEAGVAEGTKITIKTSPSYPHMLDTSIVLANQLNQIGLKAEVMQLEWGALNTALNNSDFEIASDGSSFFPDPDSYTYRRFYSKSPNNLDKYSNPKLDPILEKARVTLDPEERKKMYLEAQRILLEESPNIWWYTVKHIEGLSNNLKGFTQSFTGRRIFMGKTWLEK